MNTITIEDLFADLNTHYPFGSTTFKLQDLSNPEAFLATVPTFLDYDMLTQQEKTEVTTTVFTNSCGTSTETETTVTVIYTLTDGTQDLYAQWQVNNLSVLAQEVLAQIKPKYFGGRSVLGPDRLRDIIGVSLKETRAAYKELRDGNFLYFSGSEYRMSPIGRRAQETLKTAMAV